MTHIDTYPDRDLYALLNVPRDASVVDIQKSYKRLSRVFHPDKCRNGDQQQEELGRLIFIQIKYAHDILCDPVYRFAYDYRGPQAVRNLKRLQDQYHNQERRAMQRQQKQRRRRQQQQQQEDEGQQHTDDSYDTTDNEDGGQDHPDHDDEEDEELSLDDWYTAIRYARSKDEAQAIVDGMMSYIRLHTHSTSRTTISTEATVPYSLRNYEMERGSVNWNVNVQQPLLSNLDAFLMVDSQWQKNSLCEIQPSFVVQSRTVPGSSVSAGIRLNHSTVHHPLNITLSTSRVMANRTRYSAHVTGYPGRPESWMCGLQSNRILHWIPSIAFFGDMPGRSDAFHRDQTAKYKASWRIGFRPKVRQWVYAIASLKPLAFPAWGFRWGLSGSFPLKITYQTARVDTPYMAYSLEPLSGDFRIKVAWIAPWRGQGTIKYAIRYDSLIASANRDERAWHVSIRLSSADNWTINLPIRLIPDVRYPIVVVLTAIIRKLLHQELQPWIDLVQDRYLPLNKAPSFHLQHPSRRLEKLSLVIAQVAAKKRLSEEAGAGLLVLSAIWNIPVCFRSPSSTLDVTNLVQYWVVDGYLSIPFLEFREWAQLTTTNCGGKEYSGDDNDDHDRHASRSWWEYIRTWLTRNTETRAQSSSVNARSTLAIRYRYRNHVYDILFEEGVDNELVLPNHASALLGDAKVVIQ